MNPKDQIVYHDNFNPLQWIMDLYQAAEDSEYGKASREFMFDSPMTELGLHNAQVCWYYYRKVVNNPHPELNRIIIILNKENTHLVAYAQVDGFTPEDMKKHFGGVTNGPS